MSLELVGHSQGTLLVAAALYELAHDQAFTHLDAITVYTFGTPATLYPAGPTYYHCLYANDLVNVDPDILRGTVTMIPPPSWVAFTHDLKNYLLDLEDGKCPGRE